MDAPTETPIIALTNVTKVFLTDDIETHALSKIDLHISHGEYVAIGGPSGSGKTTLLSILGLLDTATSGSYDLAGQSVTTLTKERRAQLRNKQIGFIFQSFNLIGDLTVQENVELPLVHRGIAPTARRARAERALGRVEMSHRSGHFPSQLSGGQQQRVAVARAIVGEPVILLADEPTGNLDSKNGDLVMELLRDLHRSGSTVCMVTHNPDYNRHATRCVSMLDGVIVGERGA